MLAATATVDVTLSDNLLTEIAQILTPTATPTPAGDVPFVVIPLTPALPPPTIDATPVMATSVTETAFAASVTPVPGTATPQPQPSITPSPFVPTATFPPVTPIAQTLPEPSEQALPGLPGTIGYVLGVEGDVVEAETFNIPQNPLLFAQNPANPDQYIAVNGAGQMFFVASYARRAVERVPLAPFTEDHYRVNLIDQNNAAVRDIAWAPDGTLAFRIQGNTTNQDGVWVWTPGGDGYQAFRDCPPEAGCQTVRDTAGLSRWRSFDIAWSPLSDALLARLYLPDEQTIAFVVIDRNDRDPETVPGPVCRYSHVAWGEGGEHLVVAGFGPDSALVLGRVDRTCTPLAEMRNLGLLGWIWTSNPVEYNGRIYALAQRDVTGPAYIIDETGLPIAGPIGSTMPERVAWSAERNRALVTTSDGTRFHFYVASLDRQTAEDITQLVPNARAVQWVYDLDGQGGAPPGPQPPATPPPTPVAPDLPAGSAVQVILTLNFRATPTAASDANILATLAIGERLTLVAGPEQAEGYPWYQVRRASGETGWVAGVIDGNPALQVLPEGLDFPALVATPAPDTPALVDTPAPASGGNPLAFLPGEIIEVLRELNLREGPTTGANVILVLQPSSLVEVVQGPIQDGTAPWFQVRLGDGTVGWLAAGVFGEPTVGRPGE